MTKDEIKTHCQKNLKVKFDDAEYYIVEINELKQEAQIKMAMHPELTPIDVSFDELEEK